MVVLASLKLYLLGTYTTTVCRPHLNLALMVITAVLDCLVTLFVLFYGPLQDRSKVFSVMEVVLLGSLFYHVQPLMRREEKLFISLDLAQLFELIFLFSLVYLVWATLHRETGFAAAEDVEPKPRSASELSRTGIQLRSTGHTKSHIKTLHIRTDAKEPMLFCIEKGYITPVDHKSWPKSMVAEDHAAAEITNNDLDRFKLYDDLVYGNTEVDWHAVNFDQHSSTASQESPRSPRTNSTSHISLCDRRSVSVKALDLQPMNHP